MKEMDDALFPSESTCSPLSNIQREIEEKLKYSIISSE